jgi:oxygen-independent coproporphyrinogen-3 oxidase
VCIIIYKEGERLRELAVYVHMPFCQRKCYYCDFISFSNENQRIDEYVNFLLMEMNWYKPYLKGYSVKTIFIGGGTPSFVDGKHIKRIIEFIREKYNAENVEEITLEANPGTLNREKLALYKKAGINRISLGVQTLNDKLLKSIGRIHNSEDAVESIKLIKEMGFANVNVDLMFGLPNQTIEDCISTLEAVVDLGVEHISYYSLILEENTPIYRWYEEGRINFPDDDMDRKMYHEGVKFLKSRGFKHYEISNFSKPGYECKHNLFYWQIKPYVGFGMAAHSNVENNRFCNFTDFKDYFSSLREGKAPILDAEYIDLNMEMAEYMIMGLRLIDGVDKNEFKKRFGKDLNDVYGHVIEKYVKEGLLEENSTNVRFTEKGIDLSNVVYVDLLP